MILVDPVTREPLGELPGETEWREQMNQRATRAQHWRPGWRWGMKYENGVPVSLHYWQCFAECCKDVKR